MATLHAPQHNVTVLEQGEKELKKIGGIETEMVSMSTVFIASFGD